jgi:hypothetical protein
MVLAKDNIYQQAIHAWQHSKDELLRRRQRKTDGGSGDGTTVAELMSENRFGDPRYLDEARKALADSRKLWGMDAPERMAIEASTPFASRVTRTRGHGRWVRALESFLDGPYFEQIQAS